MRVRLLPPVRGAAGIAGLAALTAFALALMLAAGPLAGPGAAPAGQRSRSALRGELVQLRGPAGCLASARAARAEGCGRARAMRGPGPFMGSHAIAISPDGRNAYVAASTSDAIAVFRRDPRSGRLSQPPGRAGCIAAGGAGGCAVAIGLDGPNSVAVSPDGRNVYATARTTSTVAVFHRNRATGALRQLPAATGCIAGPPIPVCAAGRALLGPDVVAVSPDGRNVYVGSFFGSSVAVFDRERSSGALAQPAGSSGCIAASAAEGCAQSAALGAVEGLVVSPDGRAVYTAAALSSSVAMLRRDRASGALAPPAAASGCVAAGQLAGCTTGFELEGVNALALSPDGASVYGTSLLSNSVTSYSRTAQGALAQKRGTAGCLVYLRAVGCSFGRALVAPEGIAVSPDGANAYAAAFASGAIAVLDRDRRSGALAQKPGNAGCLAAPSQPGCRVGRALRGVSSIALSPDGRFAYATAFGSDAVAAFRRHR